VAALAKKTPTADIEEQFKGHILICLFHSSVLFLKEICFMAQTELAFARSVTGEFLCTIILFLNFLAPFF